MSESKVLAAGPQGGPAAAGAAYFEAPVYTSVPVLTVVIAKDQGRFRAHCIELDLLTEMDTAEAALNDLLVMMREYAEDYASRHELFLRSPNRAHHWPYIREILPCRDDWELLEKVTVRFGHVRPGTFHEMLRQAGMDEETFRALLGGRFLKVLERGKLPSAGRPGSHDAIVCGPSGLAAGQPALRWLERGSGKG